MKKKTLVVGAAGVAIFLLLTSVTYVYVKNYSSGNKAVLQYRAGLKKNI